jgi:starch phosphorylase
MAGGPRPTTVPTGLPLAWANPFSAPEVQDQRDGEALFHTLEKEVIPLYYGRDQDGLPLAWIARMKHAIRTLGWRFDADRMVMDYLRACYLPAAGGLSCDMSRNPSAHTQTR